MTTGIDTEKFIEDIFHKPVIWDRNASSNKSLTENCWTELSKKYFSSIPVLKAKWKGLRDMFRVEIKRIPRNEAGENLIEPHEYESKWSHYKSLLFLADHMRSRNSKFTLMDPIQKMEVFDYSYVPNEFNGLDRVTDDAQSRKLLNNIKCEPQQQQPSSHPAPPSHRIVEKRKKSIEASPSRNEISLIPFQPSVDLQQHISITKKRNLNGSAVAIDLSTVNSDAIAENETADKIINDDYHFLLSLQPFMSELSPIQKLRLRVKMQKLVFDELYGNENLL